MVDSQYYLPNDIGVSALDCGEAFRLLSPQEKMYAHYLSRAAWYVADLRMSHIQFKWCWRKELTAVKRHFLCVLKTKKGWTCWTETLLTK